MAKANVSSKPYGVFRNDGGGVAGTSGSCLGRYETLSEARSAARVFVARQRGPVHIKQHRPGRGWRLVG